VLDEKSELYRCLNSKCRRVFTWKELVDRPPDTPKQELTERPDDTHKQELVDYPPDTPKQVGLTPSTRPSLPYLGGKDSLATEIRAASRTGCLLPVSLMAAALLVTIWVSVVVS